jgi:hypothetical protein
MPFGQDPRATVWARPSRRGRYRCDSLANGSLASQTRVWVIPTNVPNPINPLWGVRAQEGGGLSFRSACYQPGIPPLIDPYPKDWTLPGSAVTLWGKSHTLITGRGETL